MSQLNAMGWKKLAVEAKFFVSFPKLPSSETVCSSCHIHRLVCLFEALLVIDMEATKGLWTGSQRDAGGWRVWILLHHRAYATPPEHTKQTHSWVNLLTIWSLVKWKMCSNYFFGAIIQHVLDWRCGHIMCDGMDFWYCV